MFRKYDIMNDNFDTEMVEKKFKKGYEDKREKRDERKKAAQYRD